MSKIQFWKQFTTSDQPVKWFIMLYSICQRYNFESNLQLHYRRPLFYVAVFDMSKIQFWKQFTTFAVSKKVKQCCIRYVKDTILKAIYNACMANAELFTAVFDMSKIQFWKQFTTGTNSSNSIPRLYSICQRYNFESNLQRPLYSIDNFCAVFDMSKIQFWKQFTTTTTKK